MKLQLSECLGESTYLEKKSLNESRQNKNKNKINLSYDILQQLSKEGKISAYDIGDKEWMM